MIILISNPKANRILVYNEKFEPVSIRDSRFETGGFKYSTTNKLKKENLILNA